MGDMTEKGGFSLDIDRGEEGNSWQTSWMAEKGTKVRDIHLGELLAEGMNVQLKNVNLWEGA